MLNVVLLIQVTALMMLIGLALVTLVSYIKSRKRLQLILAFLLISIILWGIGLIGFSMYTDKDTLDKFVRVTFASSSFMPTFTLLFALIFTQSNRIKRSTLYLIFIPSIILFASSIFTDLIVQDFNPDTKEVTYGALYPLFVLQLFAYSGWGIYILYKESKSKGIKGLQARYLFLGYGSTAALAIFINVILSNLLKSSKYSSIGFISSLTTVFAIYYVTRKYRFLDIRYLFSKLLFTILSAIFIFSSFYVVAFFIETLFGTLYSIPAYIVGGVISIIFVIYYPELRHHLQYIIDKELIRAEYDREAIYETINKVVAEELDLAKLQKKVLKVLIDSGISKGAFFSVITEKAGKENVLVKQYNLKHRLDKKAKLDPLVKTYLARTQEIVVKTEIKSEAGTDRTSKEGSGTLNHIYSVLDKYDLEILIPILNKDQLIGIIGLDEKLSETPYTAQDIFLFKKFSTPIAVAIQRAILYKESQEFSKTLQHKVDEATAELSEAYEELKRIDAEKDDFISIAGHELRTPAAIIKMSLWMLKNYKEIKSQRAIAKINNALEADERLIRLIDDLLTTSRVDRNKFKLEVSEFDIVDLIRNTVKDTRHLAEEKGLELKFRDPKKKIKIEADKDKLIEVITNLISNAAKYTDKGSITIGCEIQKNKNQVKLWVQDTGIGINKDDQNKLFRKFSRLDHSFSTTAKIRGTGLGLYITKSIIERHKGKIEVFSEGTGKGTTFTVYIPRVFIGERESGEKKGKSKFRQ